MVKSDGDRGILSIDDKGNVSAGLGAEVHNNIIIGLDFPWYFG